MLRLMTRARFTTKPAGERVGWVALAKDGTEQRQFVCQPSTGMRDSLWATGKYEWVRGLFFDGEKYSIEV